MGGFAPIPGPPATIAGALVIWLGVVIAVSASTSPRQARPAETPKAAPTAAKAALTVTPVAWLNLTGSISTGHDDYKNAGFGLRDNRNRSHNVGFVW